MSAEKDRPSGIHMISPYSNTKYSVYWAIEPFDFADDYTLRLNSVVRGMSEEVKSTVEVNLAKRIE